jgi:hypothetical protein
LYHFCNELKKTDFAADKCYFSRVLVTNGTRFGIKGEEGKDWGSFKCDITSTCWELGVLIKMMRAWPAGMQSMRKAMLNSWPTNYFAF